MESTEGAADAAVVRVKVRRFVKRDLHTRKKTC